MPKDPPDGSSYVKRVIAKNIHAMIERDGYSDNLTGWCKAHKLKQPTIYRILYAKMEPTSEQIQIIAQACDLVPWQLLVPDMNVSNPPVIKEPNGTEKKLYQDLQEIKQVVKELQSRPSGN